MKKGVIWIALTFLLVTSLVLASCAKSPTTSSTTLTTTTKTTTTSASTTTTTPTVTTTPTTTAATGNWWNKLGTPQYGGQMTLQTSIDFAYFDPYQGEAQMAAFFCWMEQLFATDWTMDPAVQSYQISFWPNDQAASGLVKTWEFTAPGTLVLHVQQGIHWQNIPPANGRLFNANDIVFHFDRMLGMGDGYTTPSPYWSNVAWTKTLTSVTATGDYTVTMQFSTPNPEFVTENLEAPGASTSIENSEAVQQWGNLNDWHHAIGTGPFILTDYVSGSSATLVKNKDYWGHDQRYPQNPLPYVDKINYLVMPDPSTALAAMRSGKIDILDQVQLAQAKSMQSSNPEIVQIPVPYGTGFTLDPRNDLAPFSDIKVREALQMAINLPDIAANYYQGTCSPDPLSLTSAYLKGWGFPYSQWPQDLKDQYAYNVAGAKALLTAAGLPNGFHTDIVAQNVVDLNLLQVIKDDFAAINVTMDIRPMDSATFSNYVNTGHKNTGLAERSTGALGLAFYPIRDLNRLQFGQPSDVAMVNDPVFNAFYPQALAATTVDQVKQVLIDANKYVAQQHFVISLLQPVSFNLCQPWLKGYNAQYGATAGSSGPFFCWFYEARFWVDQSVK